MTKLQGFSEDGGKIVVTQGLNSTTYIQKSYPLSTITVYLAGTVTLATIYSDSASTPKANPFTAASDGGWFFYAGNGNYDVVFSGAGITTPFTLSDFSIGGTTVECSNFPGATPGVKIAACIAAVPATGGTADASLILGGAIAVDVFAGITKPGKLILGAGTYVVTVAQNQPDNWEVQGAGIGNTVVQASGNFGDSSPFRNSKRSTYTATTGHNTGLSIHDLTIDGGSSTNSHGVLWFGIDNSIIWNVNVINFPRSGVDIRDGNSNVVDNCWCDCVRMVSPYHAFGGGQLIANSVFRYNKFLFNHAKGGISGDHYDINGNAAGAVADLNAIIGNTSEDSPSEGIFSDSCTRTLIAENIVRNPVTYGIAVTSGNVLSFGVSVTGNQVSWPAASATGKNSIFIQNACNDFLLSENVCSYSPEEAIVVNGTGNGLVSGNRIISAGEKTAATYAAIKLDVAGGNTTSGVVVSGNHVTDPNTKITYAVAITSTNTGNKIAGNFFNGGAAGSSGEGVNDANTTVGSNIVFGNSYNNAYISLWQLWAGNPQYLLRATGNGANEKDWKIDAGTQTMRIRTQSDDRASDSGVWDATRSALTITRQNWYIGANVLKMRLDTTTGFSVYTLPVYANNAAALAGGLLAGGFYRSGADPDVVSVVH